MMANKQQWCGIAGWTIRQFDAAIVKGFPAHKKTSSRGDIWQIDTRDGIAWMVEQEASTPRPRPRTTPRGEPPEGYEVFAAAEGIEDLPDAISFVNCMAMLYEIPRLTALVASDFGLSMDALFELSGGLLLTLDGLCRKQHDFWPADPPGNHFIQAGFSPINWPWLAEKTGESDWTPPFHALCWMPLSDEERAASVEKGRQEEAAWATEEQNAAADG